MFLHAALLDIYLLYGMKRSGAQGNDRTARDWPSPMAASLASAWSTSFVLQPRQLPCCLARGDTSILTENNSNDSKISM